MTEKEFDNLKEGDKVWIFLGKPKKTFVIAKQRDIGSGILSVKVDDGGHHPTYVAEYVFLTKSEALEAEIKHEEKIVENNERGIANAKERIARYKAELAKAKEEEEKEQKVWTVDFEEGSVICSTKWRWEHSGECYEYEAGSDRYKPCSTEQEAYEALAEYYTKKAEEAWIKSGAKFYGTYKMVALLNHIKPIKGSQMVHATCVWQRSCYCGKYSTKNTEGEWQIDGEKLFDTEAEAYAKMEKETPQYKRADDYADEISERFKAEADARALEAATRRQV